MVLINRIPEITIQREFNEKKAIILLGARQVGKTTLLKKMLNSKPHLWLNADEPDVQNLFENPTSTFLKEIIGNHNIMVLDEAQRIKNIGIKLKLITDNMPGVKLLVTGSSSLELSNAINEPLTGRKNEHILYPLSFEELKNHFGLLEERRMLEHRLIYGAYPEVVTHTDRAKHILKQLSDSYLYKDILIWNKIKKSDKLVKLLQALALQIGSQVSYNELANKIGIDAATVENYIDLLEKSFIIFRLNSYSRNPRVELTKSKKIYFTDNGIRNTVIANFAPLNLRNDVGALWENYIISERIKYNAYHHTWKTIYFWRSKNQQEVDFIEEYDGKLYGYEIKWNKRKARITKAFTNNYPDAETKIITPENYHTFIA